MKTGVLGDFDKVMAPGFVYQKFDCSRVFIADVLTKTDNIGRHAIVDGRV